MNTITTRLLTLIALAFTLQTATVTAGDIDIVSGSYSFNGTYGYIAGKVANTSNRTTGTIRVTMWLNSYIGADTGWWLMYKNWGGNYAGVFKPYQSWTCTKYGTRRKINRYGYISFDATEYTTSGWVQHDELWFSRRGLW